nr:hypothetical protein [Leptospira interrogans]
MGHKIIIGNGAEIGNGARTGDEVIIGHKAIIGERATIEHGVTVKSIIFSGSMHVVSYWGEDRIQIGYKSKSIAEWIDCYKDIEGYSDEQIEEYRQYISFISEFHKSEIKVL